MVKVTTLMGPLWEKDGNWVWQFHFHRRPSSHPPASASIIYLITDIVAWVTLNLGDKHDYLIIIMLPNICSVSLPALPPSIFNELLTQWAKETSVAQQKKSISDLYQLDTKRRITAAKYKNWLSGSVWVGVRGGMCVWVYDWLLYW